MKTETEAKTVIDRRRALEIIKSQGSSLFSVQFTKKDGSIRDMTCRLHCELRAQEANKTGKRRGPNQDENMVTVFDAQKENPDPTMARGQFRTINVKTLISLHAGGVQYSVQDVA